MENHIPGGYAPELSSHDLTVKMPDGFRREPSDQVIENLKFFVRRSRRSRGVQLARSFVRRENTPEAVPPLALLLRGGQGGEVRLKLYLTMLLLAVQPPFDIRDSFPAGSWAAALGL